MELITEDEYKRLYGDDHKRLPKLFSVEEHEADFNTHKLEVLLSKTGLFHRSLLDALIRFNRTLLKVRELNASAQAMAAMKEYRSLQQQGEWILSHFENARKLVQGYFKRIKKMRDTEGYVAAWISHEKPRFHDPSMHAQYEREVAELTHKVRLDLHQMICILFEMDKFFEDEVVFLKDMVRRQLKRVNDNHFNYAKASGLLNSMNVKFQGVVEASKKFHKVLDSEKSDLKVRKEMVARAFGVKEE
ncbi:hypothetical protein ACFL3V_05660 [Nanoarchaeota archaeon]